MPLTDTTFIMNDTLDGSRNRDQHGLHMETVKETVEVNMLTETMVPEIDSSDESKSRLNVKSLEADGASMRTVAAGLPIQIDNDSNDASQNRKFRSTLTVNFTPNVEIDVAEMEDQDQERTKKSWRRRSTMMEHSENLTSRDDRCSMSTHQKIHQPVTPVQELKRIEPTRVNIHDIDKCLVTNKSDYKQKSNRWLSNTFSRITSGILGKSKVGLTNREVITENVDTISKTQLVFKLEFNFTL